MSTIAGILISIVVAIVAINLFVAVTYGGWLLWKTIVDKVFTHPLPKWGRDR